MRINTVISVIFLIAFSQFLCSCDNSNIYQKYTDIPDKNWTYSNISEHKVSINDTNKLYNIYVNIRHTNNYTFNNLWVVVHTKFPSGKTIEKRLDLPLSDERGQWLGKCSSDICDSKIPIQYDARFNEKGEYHFTIEQNMRKNPLPEVLAVGLRVELSEVKKG